MRTHSVSADANANANANARPKDLKTTSQSQERKDSLPRPVEGDSAKQGGDLLDEATTTAGVDSTEPVLTGGGSQAEPGPPPSEDVIRQLREDGWPDDSHELGQPSRGKHVAADAETPSANADGGRESNYNEASMAEFMRRVGEYEPPIEDVKANLEAAGIDTVDLRKRFHAKLLKLADKQREAGKPVAEQLAAAIEGTKPREGASSSTDGADRPDGTGTHSKSGGSPVSPRTAEAEHLGSTRPAEHAKGSRFDSGSAPTPLNRSEGHTEDGFTVWYSTYPRKVGKSDARKAWGKLSQAKRALLFGNWSEWRTEFEGRESDYIPYPASFIRELAWEEPPPAATHGARSAVADLEGL